MVIIGDDVDRIAALKSELARCFAMKDLGTLRYFLGIEIASSLKVYLLSQSKYITDIFECVCLTDNKTIDTPHEVNARYSSVEGSPLPDPSLYRTAVGILVYLTITQPDIAHVVHVLVNLLLHLLPFIGPLFFSKKQDVVSRSFTEAKYRAMASTAYEIVWLRWLLTNMGVFPHQPTPLYCDNKSAIQIIADLFTKSHSISHFCFLSNKLSMLVKAAS
ncbi:uncharacterized protein LOC112093217 [Morus notabilis]|uniref:uncharacterized protein LOC112093217 n=1 Tax=Morus notabilis TaxID=981085 RepID=UPI000CED2FB5|nr:uncharacterized protein LOC112093217 [Morus notabilis]